MIPEPNARAPGALAWGADVLAQDEDCTAAVIRAAAAAGARTIGFNVDARRLAPKAWLTAPVWKWGPLFVDMVRTVDADRFAGPLRDQRGRLRIRGAQPSTTVLEETDYLVEGVLGTTGPRG